MQVLQVEIVRELDSFQDHDQIIEVAYLIGSHRDVNLCCAER